MIESKIISNGVNCCGCLSRTCTGAPTYWGSITLDVPGHSASFCARPIPGSVEADMSVVWQQASGRCRGGDRLPEWDEAMCRTRPKKLNATVGRVLWLYRKTMRLWRAKKKINWETICERIATLGVVVPPGEEDEPQLKITNQHSKCSWNINHTNLIT